jgi:hypothetical protein
MNIVTYLPQGCQLSDLKATCDYDLEAGHIGEETIARALTAHGLPAYRPQQRFADRDKLHKESRLHKRKGRAPQCFLKIKSDKEALLRFQRDKEIAVIPGDPHMDKELLRPHQLDVRVKVSKVKRLSVEVKVLTGSAFFFYDIHVGCCPKWDEKAARGTRVDALILINQETGEAFVAPPQDEWKMKPSKTNKGELDYTISHPRLTPLEIWMDFVKDSYSLDGISL